MNEKLVKAVEVATNNVRIPSIARNTRLAD